MVEGWQYSFSKKWKSVIIFIAWNCKYTYVHILYMKMWVVISLMWILHEQFKSIVLNGTVKERSEKRDRMLESPLSVHHMPQPQDGDWSQQYTLDLMGRETSNPRNPQSHHQQQQRATCHCLEILKESKTFKLVVQKNQRLLFQYGTLFLSL